jgi:hypothetical protein
MAGSLLSKPMSKALGALFLTTQLSEGDRLSVRQGRTRNRSPYLSLSPPRPLPEEKGNRSAGGAIPGQVMRLTVHGAADPTRLRATDGRP